MQQSTLTPSPYFSSVVYTIEKPEFLKDAMLASNELLEQAKKARPINDTYPSVMSSSMSGLSLVAGLERFIAESAWIILDNQGYKMDGLLAYVSEFWAQEHFKYSGMEQHVHPHGVVISGFYFLTSPDDGCMVEIHDPRPGKVQASLPFKDLSKVGEANNSLFIKPKPGMFVFTNSWLPHSFTRNSSDESVKFIHFNVSVRPADPPAGPIIV